MRIELPFATGFYEDFSKPLAAQECINLHVIVPQTNALSPAALISTPGLEDFSSLSGKNRGSHTMNNISYFVNGNRLFRVNSDGTNVDLGAIDGATRVSMADNGTQLCIVVPGITGYIFTEDPAILTEITDAVYFELGPSLGVSYKDSFFIHIGKDRKAFFISNINDGLVYNALDFGTAEVDPDGIVASNVTNNQLFMLGRNTIEVFQNIGGADFPYQSVRGAVVSKGLTAPFAVASFDNSFVFMGGAENEKPAIWRYSGNTATKISNSGIDLALQQYSEGELDSAFAMTYAENGSFFVIFTLLRNTFVYDATASALQGRPVWHERRSGTNGTERWIVNSMVKAYGEILVGDAFTGRVGRMSLDIDSEYGETIFRSFATAPFEAQNRNMFVSNIELTVETGTANAVDPGSEPVVRLSFSDDGGRTFSNEISRSMGKIGEYNHRVIWRRQGRASTDRVARFRCSERVKVSFLQLTADVEFENIPGPQ